jgi:hypothetical protein
LQVSEESIAEATGLSQEGDRWFKNMKIDGIPWHSLLVSKKSHYNVKGMPIQLFKTRWHGLLLVIKQFITCEGRYGLVLLFHIRLLMIFQGFKLNLPFYFLKSLRKMSKFYQRQNPNPKSSLFHHGLIHILVNFQLVNTGDTWQSFLLRNGFIPSQIDPDSHLPQGIEEPVFPNILSHSLQDFRVEVQIPKDSVFSTSDPIKFPPVTEITSKKHEFIPKRSLEEILSHLRSRSPNIPGHSQPQNSVVNNKIKRKGKQIKQDACDMDFKNKRSGQDFVENDKKQMSKSGQTHSDNSNRRHKLCRRCKP